MKTLTTILVLLLAASSFADTVMVKDGKVRTFGSTQARVFGSVTPPIVQDLQLLYQFLNNNNPTADGSGIGNNGGWGALTWNSPTNGLSGNMTFGAGGAITSTVTTAHGYLAWMAATNITWKFYEYLNGTTFVDRVATAYPTNQFFTQAGNVITWGGGTYSADEYRVYVTNTPSLDVGRAYVERESKANVGVLSSYLRDTPSVWSNCVLNVTFNNVIQDGSKEHNPLLHPSAPTLVNVKPNSAQLPNGNAAASFNGSANYVQSGLLMTSPTNQATIAFWCFVSGHSSYAGFVSATAAGSASYCNIIQGNSANGIWGYFKWQDFLWNAGKLGNMSTNAWQHVVFTFDGATSVVKNATVYVNAVEVASKTDPSDYFNVSTNMIIGNDTSVSGRFLNGLMDEVMVLWTHYTPQMVTNLYNSQTNLFF
jgi:hypothetical protein